MTQLGDVNGDGLTDIATLEESWEAVDFHLDLGTSQFIIDAVDQKRQLVIYLQDPREPDVVSGISGGPHTPAVTIDYEYAGPNSSRYQMGTGCSNPQRCMRSLGWVVSKHSMEAAGFEASVTSSKFEHEYSDGRLDLAGRGFVGVAKYIKKDKTDANSAGDFVFSQEFDVSSRVEQPTLNSRKPYVYRNSRLPQHTHTSLPVTSGTYEIDVVTDAPMVASGVAFHVARQEDVLTETEGALIRSRRVVRLTDDFNLSTSVSVEDADGALPDPSQPSQAAPVHVQTWSAKGQNASNTSTWLIDRYADFEDTSSEPGLPKGIRTTHVEYEPASVEPTKVVLEPNAAPETPTTSGLTRTTTLSRDPFGNLWERRIESNGEVRIFKSVFDSSENQYLVRTIDAVGNVARNYFHSGLGVLLARDGVDGIRNTLQYDPSLRVRTLSTGIRAADGRSGGHTESWAYQREPDIKGKPSRFMLVTHLSDIGGKDVKRAGPTGNVIESSRQMLTGTSFQQFAYDRFGRTTRATVPQLSSTRDAFYQEFKYDGLGRLTETSRPGETSAAPRFVTKYTYSGSSTTQSSETTSASETANQTTTTVDSRGRLVERKLHDAQLGRNTSTTYTWGPFDTLHQVLHPSLNVPMSSVPAPLVTEIDYDVLGRRTLLKDPDSGTTEFRYNGFGEAKARVDGNGVLTTFVYDAVGRPISATTAEIAGVYPSRVGNGLSQSTHFTWDTHVRGLLSSATSNDGVEYEQFYDEFSRPSIARWTVPGGGIGKQHYDFSSKYDTLGRLDTLEYPQTSSGHPFRVRQSYGINGELTAVFDASSTKATSGPEPELWRATAETALGLRSEERLGGEQTVRRSYDKSGQLRLVKVAVDATGAVLQNTVYSWGRDELLRARADLAGGLVENFEHDAFGRLSAWTTSQNCLVRRWRYEYDDLGNLRVKRNLDISAETRVSIYATPTSPSRIHALKEVRAETETGTVVSQFGYDQAGNMTSGRGGQTYAWTPFGVPMRISDSAGTDEYLFDALGGRTVTRKTDSSGALLRESTTLAGLFELRREGKRLDYVYNVKADNRTVALVKREVGGSTISESREYVYPDHIGSPDVVYDTGKGVAIHQKFDPFGAPRFEWAVADSAIKALPTDSTMAFSGHESDGSFGLVNMGGRVYDPEIQHFLSPDPLSAHHSQALNRYAYAQNSPVMRVDRSGFQSAPYSQARGYVYIPGSDLPDAGPTTSASDGGWGGFDGGVLQGVSGLPLLGASDGGLASFGAAADASLNSIGADILRALNSGVVQGPAGQSQAPKVIPTTLVLYGDPNPSGNQIVDRNGNPFRLTPSNRESYERALKNAVKKFQGKTANVLAIPLELNDFGNFKNVPTFADLYFASGDTMQIVEIIVVSHGRVGQPLLVPFSGVEISAKQLGGAIVNLRLTNSALSEAKIIGCEVHKSGYDQALANIVWPKGVLVNSWAQDRTPFGIAWDTVTGNVLNLVIFAQPINLGDAGVRSDGAIVR